MMRLGRFFQIALLILLAVGAQPAYSAFWQWSRTAGNNADADPSINWREGMSPSSVNDSARALMARAAEYRDDISGVLTLGGTSTAYTLTTNQGLASVPTTGQMIAFKPNVDNGAAATLTTDGGTTYPLQITAGTALPSGTILAGTPYRASFSGTAWVMEGGYGNPYSVALGAIMWSTAPTAPNSSFVAPSGQCISTTTYAAYWVQQGSPASGACPGGQFAIIDMRGRVPAGLDTLNASAAGRLTSSATGCGTAMTSVGAVCANGTEGSVIPLAQLPTGITANGSVTVNAGKNLAGTTGSWTNASEGAGGGATLFAKTDVADVTNISSMTNPSVTLTSNNTSGTARPNVQHTIGLIPYLRIL